MGSLIGVACIVIFNKLGYVSAVSGVVMAVCAIKGYALLGGKLTRRGAVISGLFILVMTYIATKLCFALAVMEAATEDDVCCKRCISNASNTTYSQLICGRMI